MWHFAFQMDHKDNLSKLCRICGQRVQLKKEKSKGNNAYKPKLVRSYHIQILKVYSLDTALDNADLHPESICKICYQRLMNFKSKRGIEQRNLDKYRFCAQRTNAIWKYHDVQSCVVCLLFQHQAKKNTQRITYSDYAALTTQGISNISNSLQTDRSAHKWGTVDWFMNATVK